jgi:hypothetical protein
MDGRLCGSGHAWAWPAVVARAKAGDGRILMRECTARVMAYLWGPSVEVWELALAHFVAEGLLELDGDEYLVAGWDDYQRDNTGAERQRRHRASRRNGDVTDGHVTPRDVTSSNGDVTLRHVTSRDSHAYSTVQDRTVQDSTVAADAAITRAHAPAREAATAATTCDQLGAVAERWRLALRGKTGAAPLVVGALDIDALSAAVAERGADYVMKCIDRSAEVAGGGGPSLSLLRMILRDGVHPAKAGQNRSKPVKPNDHDPKRVNDAWVDVPDQGYTF